MGDTIPIGLLPLACSYWLQQQIQTTVIPAINTTIASMYTNEANPALFAPAVVMAEVTNTGVPVICVWAEKGSQPIPLEMKGLSPNSKVALAYNIRIVLPVAGGSNTATDFELSKQCAIGGLTEFLWDTTRTLAPTVFTKADPNATIQAMAPCRAGDWRSVYLKPLEDKTTLPRGVEISYTFQFQINGSVVLSAPS